MTKRRDMGLPSQLSILRGTLGRGFGMVSLVKDGVRREFDSSTDRGLVARVSQMVSPFQDRIERARDSVARQCGADTRSDMAWAAGLLPPVPAPDADAEEGWRRLALAIRRLPPDGLPKEGER